MDGIDKPGVLLVDDDASNLNILNQILKERYRIFAAKTGETALRLAEEKTPSLILLDMVLPDISGQEVLTRLKAQADTRDIPVIVISALTGEDGIRQCIGLGAADYIAKPFSSSNVKDKVAACFR